MFYAFSGGLLSFGGLWGARVFWVWGPGVLALGRRTPELERLQTHRNDSNLYSLEGHSIALGRGCRISFGVYP